MKNSEKERHLSSDQALVSYDTELFGRTKIEHYYPIIDGVKLHYTESGTGGSRIIVLGGLPFYAWEGFVGFIKPFAAKGHTVNVFEYPGFGESQAFSNREHNFENVTEILHKTIEQEGLAPAHIAGLSFGGGAALHLAAKYPDDVKSIILHGVPIEFPKIVRRSRQFLKNPKLANDMQSLFAKKYLWLPFFTFLISDPEPAQKLYGQKWIIRLAKKYAEISPKALREYSYSILATLEEKWAELASKTHTPTAIVISEKEAQKEERLQIKGPHATGIKLKKLIPHAQLLVNPDVATPLGHGKGKPFAETVLPFIEAVDNEGEINLS